MKNDAIKKGSLISLEMLNIQVAEPKWQHLVRDKGDGHVFIMCSRASVVFKMIKPSEQRTVYLGVH